MTGIEILKLALEEGVKVLPRDFLKRNNIKSQCLGRKKAGSMDECAVYLIEEEGEFKDKVVYTY